MDELKDASCYLDDFAQGDSEMRSIFRDDLRFNIEFVNNLQETLNMLILSSSRHFSQRKEAYKIAERREVSGKTKCTKLVLDADRADNEKGILISSYFYTRRLHLFFLLFYLHTTYLFFRSK